MRTILYTLLALAPLTLSACGMKPVYGTYAQNKDARAQMATIRINNIPDRIGQNLRNNLIDSLYIHGYPAADSPYFLNIATIIEREQRLGIAKDASTTRAQIRLNTVMTLTDTTTKKNLFSRRLLAVASYNNLPSQYTTEVAKAAAREDATRELSNQILNALELYFSNPAAYSKDATTELKPFTPQADLIDDVSLDSTR